MVALVKSFGGTVHIDFSGAVAWKRTLYAFQSPREPYTRGSLTLRAGTFGLGAWFFWRPSEIHPSYVENVPPYMSKAIAHVYVTVGPLSFEVEREFA